jgi:hypothetical protein
MTSQEKLKRLDEVKQALLLSNCKKESPKSHHLDLSKAKINIKSRINA